MSKNAKLIYQEKIDDLNVELEHLDNRYKHFSSIRVTSFFAALILGIFNYTNHWFSMWWFSIYLAFFLTIIVLHEILVLKQNKLKFKLDFHQAGLDRISGKWREKDFQHAIEADHEHSYAHDLDLFGSSSFFNLLCLAYSQNGKEQLKKWLTIIPSQKTILKRQEATQELTEQLDFRLKLCELAQGIAHTIHPSKLIDWAKKETSFSSKENNAFKVIACILSLSMLVSLYISFAYEKGVYAFLIVLMLELIFYSFINKRLKPLLADISAPNKELNYIASILKILEHKNFTSKFLTDLQESLKDHDVLASNEIQRFDKLIKLLDLRRNQLLTFFTFIFMWNVHLGLRIESWREKHGKKIHSWLEAVGEFEAITSISNYAFEHQSDVYPTLSNEDYHFHGIDLGHPLIEDKICVRNSVDLNPDCRLFIVSGSNMCGKSTFLRVIGINLVLTYIGAPVRAKSLIVSNLALGSSINVQDSLKEGYSKFFAEITKVKSLMDDAKKETPLLFLYDELLHGTNSHDRLIGAKAIIAKMLELNAIGLVTTHDLTLTKAIKELKLKAKNVHFRDDFHGDRLVFDYKLHPGVVEKSNALELMRSVGIEV